MIILFNEYTPNPSGEFMSFQVNQFGYPGPGNATTSAPGSVQLATIAQTTAGTRTDLACTPAGVAAVAIAGAPAASTSQPGIIEIANNSEAAAQAATNLALVPSNLPSIMAAPGAIGGTTPAAGTFTGLVADSTGAITLDADAASNFSVAGVGVDLTLASAGGRVVVNGEEAAADALRLVSAAGGLDVDVALLASITSTRNNAQAILVEATAGGIDILASGAAAGEDIDIVATGSSVNITATESANDAIVLTSSSGGIDILGSGPIDIVATGAALALSSTVSAANSISLTSTAGGIDILATGAAAGEDIDIVATGSSVNISATENAADSITIVSTVGGIDITCSGAAAGEDIDITATGSSVNITATENDAGCIYVRANGGTSERIRLHADQGTGVDSVYLLSDVGGITLEATGLASADGINLVATAGGIDMDSALLTSITSSRNNAQAILVEATAGGIDILASGAAAGEDIDIVATGSSVNISATENAADSITIVSTAGGIDVTAAGAAGEDIDVTCTAGSINLTAGEAAADAIVISASDAAGGIVLDAGTGKVSVTGANLALTTAATQLQVEGGAATDFIGTGTLTSGTVTISNTNIAAADRIFIQRTAANASTTMGELSYTISAGASFTVTSLILGTPGSTQTGDVSSFAYFIVRQL